MDKLGSVKQYCKIKQVKNGLIELKNGDFCKVIEVFPINFALKSEREQEQILYQYKTFLKTCDFPMQILILSRRYDIERHIRKIEKKQEEELSCKVRQMTEEYLSELRKITDNKSIISRKFYLIFREEGVRRKEKRGMEEVERGVEEKVLKIKNALKKTGNEIVDFGKQDSALIDILYGVFHKNNEQFNVYGKELMSWLGL